jgi:prepilin-type processing-associated H-X9-DG protein
MKSLDFDDFTITPVSGAIESAVATVAGLAGSVLGPLADLVGAGGNPGVWKGTGFNQIWRPFPGLPAQDRFLELNETTEVLQFIEIPGDIPNRGLLQPDIDLHGITYLQKINDANVKVGGKPAGIHIEPGIWISVPNTTNPQDPATVSRLANIPHGTSLVAQGTAKTSTGAPTFAVASITPFTIAPPHTPISFPETDLSKPSKFRTPPGDIPHVTQPMVDNPNVVLAAGLAGKKIGAVTTLHVSTIDLNPPSSGGGTSNIAFLDGAAGGPNATAAQMDAIFWIEHFVDSKGKPGLQLQYTQRVLLNFNTLSWPHISVATLVKQ